VLLWGAVRAGETRASEQSDANGPAVFGVRSPVFTCSFSLPPFPPLSLPSPLSPFLSPSNTRLTRAANLGRLRERCLRWRCMGR